MAKCDLTIELENPKEVFHPGDEVRGFVTMATDGSVKVNALTIDLGWSTHGRGNTASGEPERLHLYNGEITSASTTRYPFHFAMPNGPVTYRGHYLNVGWFLKVRADIPWKIDPKAELEIVLWPGSEEHQQVDWQRQYHDGRMAPGQLQEALQGQAGNQLPFAAGQSQWISIEADGSKPKVNVNWSEVRNSPVGMALGCGCLGVVLAIVGGISMALLAPVVDAVESIRAGDWMGAVPGILIGLVPVAIVVAIAVAGVRYKLVKDRFGDVKLELEPDRVRPGEAITIRSFFMPSKALELNRAVATLVARERVVSGSGTNKSTRTHDVASIEVELLPSRHLSGGMPVQIDGEVQVPPDAPPSFGASSNSLTWTLTLRYDVARFPDWSDSREIAIVP